MNQQQASADELFFVVDENDRPLQPVPRKLVHGHSVWHRVAHIWIMNSSNILCQQRSYQKELNPGYWECFFGGHCAPSETYAETALRELHEELGLDVAAKDLQFWKTFRYLNTTVGNNEFQGIFMTHWDGDTARLHFVDGEVAQVAWRTIDKIQRSIVAGHEPWTNCGYELALLKELKHGSMQ